MDISLSGRHMQLTDQTKDYTLEKVQKFERFYDRITDVKTVLCKDGGGYTCELVMVIPNHQNIVINKRAENLYTAIDEAINIGERKLRQFKNKRRDMKGHLHDLPDQV